MNRIAALALAALLAATPAFAQQRAPRTPEAAAPPSAPLATAPLPAPQPLQPAPNRPAPARTGMSSGHALALGIGMFGGAVLGSALIHGGSFAAAVGAVAGLSVGHWYYLQHQHELD